MSPQDSLTTNQASLGSGAEIEAMASKDYYGILGVQRDASPEQLRSAYRRLARDNHPDRNPNDQKAEERFKEITRAYEVLGNAEKRKVYDEFGMEAEAIDYNADQARTYRRWAEQQTRGGSASHAGSQGFPSEFSDLFGDLFGGAGFSNFSQGPQAGADIRTEMRVTFRESVLGGERRIQLERPGSLAVSLDVRVPVGVEDGQTIRLKGQGALGTNGAASGDLLIKLVVEPHEHLRRDGTNLHLDVPISIKEALLGGEIDVPTLEGKSVHIRLPKGAQAGQKLRIKGKGVPARASREAGDLYVHLQITLPEHVPVEDPMLVAAIERIEGEYKRSVRDKLVL